MPISEQGPPAAAWVKYEGLYYWIEGGRSHRKVYQMYLEGKVGPHDRPTEEIMKCEQGSPNADWAGKETEERQALCQAQAAARAAQQFEAKAAAIKALTEEALQTVVEELAGQIQVAEQVTHLL